MLNNQYKVLFIHSTTKHLDLFLEEGFNNLVCLPGDEIRKIKDEYTRVNSVKFVVSNENETEIDSQVLNSNFYVVGESSIDTLLENKLILKEAPLFMSLKVADILEINKYYLVGFDGYEVETTTTKLLREENQTIIDNYSSLKKKNLTSLTPTQYNLEVKSLYSLIVHGE